MNKVNFAITLSLVFGFVALNGCAPKNKLQIEETEDIVDEESIEDTSGDDDFMLTEDIEINQDWTDVSALGVVTFELDSAKLSTQNRATLKTNVAILKKLPKSVSIRVAGHCDDRGTVEYNIALGQRRAHVVRNFYVTSGVAKSRISTISFGEERPACSDQTEECWARNRRAVTRLKNDEYIVIKKDESEQ